MYKIVPGIIQALNRMMGSSKHVQNRVTLTTGAGVEGSWVEIFPSSTIFGNWLNITFHDTSVDADFEIDIGIGASGEEVVHIPNILHHSDPLGNNITSLNIVLKVDIPKYARISARAQNGNAETIDLNVIMSGVEFD